MTLNSTSWREVHDQIYNVTKETLALISAKIHNWFDENDQIIKDIFLNKNNV